MNKPVVLLYEPIHQQALKLLAEQAEVRIATSLNEDDLIKVVSDVEGIIIQASGKVSRRLMDSAPKLYDHFS
ncbi:MAG: hypothetical protein MUO64_00245 [Anaerolineales bacterium]|nr:hypothetical protein [Anaerolineales bacterium]